MAHLISVVVPVYNAERYITRCINSIKEQTYQNWELLLVNDGSTDNSLILCQEYARTDHRIKVVDKKNGGASSARNAGLDMALGDYIVFVDADDFVSKHYIEHLYEAARFSECDIVQCDMMRVQNEPVDKDSQTFSHEKIVIMSKEEALNRRKYKVCVWGKIYIASLFEKYRFPEGIIYEDDASYYKLVYSACKVAVYRETLYFYYMSNDSVMRNKKKNKSLAFNDIYEERIAFFITRKENKLVQGSYIRYCIVLMLFIADSKMNRHNLGDVSMLVSKYKYYYDQIDDFVGTSFLERLLLMLYRYIPWVLNPLIALMN